MDPWVLGFSIVHELSGVAIGSCGFKAPPDEDGMVEIAYGLVPPHQNKGYATEAAEALVRFLRKCGFHQRGQVIDPEDGPVFRWEIECRT